VITLFWTQQIGMSITEIMVLQAIFALAVVVLEFPSGYLADRVGHRAALLIGSGLWLAGWTLYSFATTFAAVAGAEVVLGAGVAFASGADSALLYESLEAAERARDYARWEGRARAGAQVSEALSSVAGGWLYPVAPRLPFWLQVPTAIAALATAARLGEVHPRAPERHSHLARVVRLLRFALAHHRRLRTAIALSVALGLSSFVMVWLIQPWMKSRGIPVGWFGPVWAAFHLWLAAVSLVSTRVAGWLGRQGALLVCCPLVVLGYGGLGVTAAPYGAAFYLLLLTARGLQGPILASAIQEDTPADDRASILSLNALLFRLGFVALGPPIGVLVDRLGLDRALLVLALGFLILDLAAWLAFVRARPAPTSVA
jgi:MFS family permease